MHAMCSSHFAVLLLLVSIATSHPSKCSYTDPTYKVSFNYYGLQLRSKGQLDYYKVQDVRSGDGNTSPYTYYFNLCAPVVQYPEQNDKLCLYGEANVTQKLSYCEAGKINTSTTPNTCQQTVDERESINGKAYAYQMRTDGKLCYPLSSNEDAPYTISLYDALDPTQGITIKYINGAWSDQCGANRQLKIHLKCENDPSSVPRQTDVIENPSESCNYELTVFTMHGCPAGCPAYANSLCAAQGLCGYDFGSNRSRCFCYWGYTGSSCQRINAALIPFKPLNTKSDSDKGDYVHTFSPIIPMTDPISGRITEPQVHVTYDVSNAHSYDTVYQINDTAAASVNEKYDYQYYFNIGGTIDSTLLPIACQNVLMPCEDITGDGITDCYENYAPSEKRGFAYRYTNNSGKTEDDQCLMLGTVMALPWLLYDTEDNPAHGIKITYRNGSFSDSDGVNCAFSINLICPDTRVEFFEAPSGVIYDASEITDHGGCQFEGSFETAWACPFNCITQEKQGLSVCSGAGMCIADPSAGFVRCICDESNTGQDCGVELNAGSVSTKKHSDAGFNVTIVIISMLLIGFMGGVLYLWRRNKTLEKYAVPILDEHEQIEPTVPDYSDSDGDEEHGHGHGHREMITVTTNNVDMNSFKQKLFGGGDKLKQKIKQKRFKKQGKNKYQAQNLNISEEEEEDDYSDDENNGPSAYLAANQGDDSDTN